MTRVRRRVLGTIATLWLCSQAATMTLAAAVIGMVPFVDVALQCTCTHAAGDSAMCPMHQGQSHQSGSRQTGPPHTGPGHVMPAGSHAGHAGHAAHAAGQNANAAQTQTPTSTPTPTNGGACYMRSADTASGAALVSVFGPLGLLAPSTFSFAPAIVNPHGAPTRVTAIDRTLPPEPPPPRA
jgi:hypothetical protein